MVQVIHFKGYSLHSTSTCLIYS
ncbi:hypothetical protein R3I94_013301 [Phoxinus phoxinus]